MITTNYFITSRKDSIEGERDDSIVNTHRLQKYDALHASNSVSCKRHVQWTSCTYFLSQPLLPPNPHSEINAQRPPPIEHLAARLCARARPQRVVVKACRGPACGKPARWWRVRRTANTLRKARSCVLPFFQQTQHVHRCRSSCPSPCIHPMPYFWDLGCVFCSFFLFPFPSLSVTVTTPLTGDRQRQESIGLIFKRFHATRILCSLPHQVSSSFCHQHYHHHQVLSSFLSDL